MLTRSTGTRLRSCAYGSIASFFFLVSPIGLASGPAQQRPRPAAPQAAPAAPRVSVVAIRVVGAGLGANGSELRAFNESPGTALALGIQAPPGAGIVEIDNRASKVESFSDDKGQNLLEEGRIGSFPKIAEDGSAAIVEVEVHARPSAGAVSVNAQGSLNLTLANGSKPQRIPNVRLEPNRAMKVGSATITITAAKVDGESTNLTFGLTRTVLNTIRTVRFFDAKGAPIEARRTSSGYFNEKAELEFTAQTKETIVAVEFDVWQSPRVINVPFKVQAGLGVAPGGGAGTSEASPAAQADARAKAPDNRPPPVIAPGEGAESIDAVVKNLQTAMAAGKAGPALSVIHPHDRAQFAQGIAMVVTFSTLANMSDEKATEKAQKDVDALFARHKVEPPFTRDPGEVFKNTNLAAFLTDALALLKTQVKKGEDPAAVLPIPKGKPQNVTVTGDSAVAQLEGHDVKFTRVSGRWFIRLE